MREATFEAWIKQVDAHLIRTCGLSHDDLPDCTYRDWYEDGCSPARAAARALKRAKES